ncbi:MAG: cytochrome c oxidase subunit 3, partial [Aestuariivirgaceae bacterium]|nr:cytochrome c oxidase subunit 3 [Aestuariivirgaceae bacterium]
MADAHAKNHDYHLVDPSPWPIVGSLAAFVLAVGSVFYMHGSSPVVMIIGFLLVLYTMAMWWRDVIKEGQQGAHTEVVSIHMRYGMILFIASEVMFFAAWFWAYFDASLYSDEAIQAARVAATGGEWPPKGTVPFDPWHLPLINTLILLTSGTTVTWAHHALLENDRQGLKWGLILTVLLGAIFSVVQGYEYAHAAFAFDRLNGGNIYGSTFYMATGFHGFHVLVGTIFLAVCLF